MVKGLLRTFKVLKVPQSVVVNTVFLPIVPSTPVEPLPGLIFHVQRHLIGDKLDYAARTIRFFEDHSAQTHRSESRILIELHSTHTEVTISIDLDRRPLRKGERKPLECSLGGFALSCHFTNHPFCSDHSWRDHRIELVGAMSLRQYRQTVPVGRDAVKGTLETGFGYGPVTGSKAAICRWELSKRTTFPDLTSALKTD